MSKYDNVVKVDFAVFPNQFKKDNAKAPHKTGKLEMTKEFLKEMLEQAKSGNMPEITVAAWRRTSKAGKDYENFRLELPLPTEEEDDDDFPF